MQRILGSSCPCEKCLNIVEVVSIDTLKEYLLCDGIDKIYTYWSYQFDHVTDKQVDMGPYWNVNPGIEHINKKNILEVWMPNG